MIAGRCETLQVRLSCFYQITSRQGPWEVLISIADSSNPKYPDSEFPWAENLTDCDRIIVSRPSTQERRRSTRHSLQAVPRLSSQECSVDDDENTHGKGDEGSPAADHGRKLDGSVRVLVLSDEGGIWQVRAVILSQRACLPRTRPRSLAASESRTITPRTAVCISGHHASCQSPRVERRCG